MSSEAWSNAEIGRLRELWANNAHSARAIAKILDTEFGTRRTRNAVIGKVKRLGLVDKAPANGSVSTTRMNGDDRNAHPPARRRRPTHSKPPTHPGGYPSAEKQAASRAYQLQDREVLRRFTYTVPLVELTEQMCKYPDPDIHDPLVMRFCGLPRVPNSKWPYCKGHQKIAKDEKYRGKN